MTCAQEQATEGLNHCSRQTDIPAAPAPGILESGNPQDPRGSNLAGELLRGPAFRNLTQTTAGPQRVAGEDTKQPEGWREPCVQACSSHWRLANNRLALDPFVAGLLPALLVSCAAEVLRWVHAAPNSPSPPLAGQTNSSQFRPFTTAHRERQATVQETGLSNQTGPRADAGLGFPSD